MVTSLPRLLKRNWGWVFISIILICGVIWVSIPTILLSLSPFMEKKGPEHSTIVRDGLIWYGKGSIPAIIKVIRAESPWSRAYCGLPGVLEEFGSAAHGALDSAIKSEMDAKKKAYLVYSMISAFRDLNPLKEWIIQKEEIDISEWAQDNLQQCVLGYFPDAPAIFLEGKVNPEFKTWIKNWTGSTVP